MGNPVISEHSLSLHLLSLLGTRGLGGKASDLGEDRIVVIVAFLAARRGAGLDTILFAVVKVVAGTAMDLGI